MGKVNKKKGSKPHQRGVGAPYKSMDVDDTTENIKEELDFVSNENIDDQAEIFAESKEIKTKGQLQQKHKLEFKILRKKIKEIKKDKAKLNGKTQKSEKKDLAKKMKEMMQELQERHNKELEAFESTNPRSDQSDTPQKFQLQLYPPTVVTEAPALDIAFSTSSWDLSKVQFKS